MKKILFFLFFICFSVPLFSQLPELKKIDLVSIVNESKWEVYFGTGLQIGNIGYEITMHVDATGKFTASWINGSFKGQLYADGSCIGSWKHTFDVWSRYPMSFHFSPDGTSATGNYTSNDGERNRLIKIKKI